MCVWAGGISGKECGDGAGPWRTMSKTAEGQQKEEIRAWKMIHWVGKFWKVISLEKVLFKSDLFSLTQLCSQHWNFFPLHTFPWISPKFVLVQLVIWSVQARAQMLILGAEPTCGQERQSWHWLLISLIHDLIRSKGLPLIYGLFGLDSDRVDAKGLGHCIQFPSKSLYNWRAQMF